MSKNTKNVVLLIGLAYFFFMLGNGLLSLTNPDEVFYTQTAKEMVSHNQWLTPILFDKPQFEKPIFLYWLLRVAFFVFGVTSFAARFFPAVFASAGVLGIYFLGLISFKDEKKAFISSLVLMSCGLYIGLARTVFTDMIFSVFILFSLLAFFWGHSLRARKGVGIILFFFFAALAVLTKGPLGILIPLVVVMTFLLFTREIRFLFCGSFLWGMLIFGLLSFPWYMVMIKKYGVVFIGEFFYNDHLRRFLEAEHLANDKWYFYPLSIIGCFFPWSIFILPALGYIFKNKLKSSPAYIFILCWIASVLVIFQSAHSKLVSYILPMFPALALVIGDFITDRMLSKKENSRGSKIIFLLSWGFLSLLLIAIIAAVFKFAGFLSSRLPVLVFIVIFIAWLSVMLVFILTRKPLKSVYMLASAIPLFFIIIPFLKNDIEPYISSREACAYLKKNYPSEGIIFVSTSYARGVRYYAGNEVAAYGRNCFSPHPILFLNTDEEVADFLRRQTVTYCVIKRKQVADIQRVAKVYKFNITVLKVLGGAYLLKVSR